MKTIVLALLAVLLSVPANSSSSANPALIAVRGEGTATAPPDTATITVGVTSEGQTARQALTQNNRDMELILAELLGVGGIGETDLKTSGFRLHPNYNYKLDPPQVVGYQASNDLTIRIRDIEITGAVLDKAVSLGINNVMNNIQFSIADPREIVQLARRAAVRDAKSKAETIVEELGLKLGAVYSISEGIGTSHVPPGGGGFPQMRSMAAREASSVPIAGGENSYNVGVDISWEILPVESGGSNPLSCEEGGLK